MSYWTSFAATGDPNPEGGSLPTWPVFNAAETPYLELGSQIESGTQLNQERMKLWDRFYDRAATGAGTSSGGGR